MVAPEQGGEERLGDTGREYSLLALSYQSESAWLSVSDLVTVEDFTHPLNKTLWTLISQLRQGGAQPSPQALYQDIPEALRPDLDGMGGMQFLVSLGTNLDDVANAEFYAKQLHDLTIRRRGREAGKKIATLAEEIENADQFLDRVEGIVTEIESDVSSEVVDFGAGIDDYVQELATKPQGVMPGVSTGYEILDRVTQGLQPGRLYVVGARTGIGKSILHLNLVNNIAVQQQIPVLYISTEQTLRDERNRLLGILAELPESKIVNGDFAVRDDDVDRVEWAKEKIAKAPIKFTQQPLFTPEKLYRIIKKYVKLEPHVKVVFFDYIRIPAGSLNNKDKWAVVGDLAYGLSAIAAELDIPIISAVQINREGAKDLKFTGEIDETAFADSDMVARAAAVAMVLRPLNVEETKKYGTFTGEPSGRVLAFAKNRFGSKEHKILYRLGDTYVKLSEQERVLLK